MNSTNKSKMFKLAALINWSFALPVLFFPMWFSQLFKVEPVISGNAYEQTTALAIALFGGLYWLIGNDTRKYRAIIYFGIIGKLGVVTIFFRALALGSINATLPYIMIIDLVFTALFIHHLYRTRN